MKAYLFYRPNTDADLAISSFLQLLNPLQKDSLQLVDIHTPDGDALSRLHDIVRYPTVLVTADDGSQIKLWHGELPFVEDVGIYLSEARR